MAPKAQRSAPAWGNAPKSLALKARFTFCHHPAIIDDMPQSLSRVILHIIFSTKNRELWLDSEVRPRMQLIWLRSAVTLMSSLCKSAGLLITFTL